VKTLRFAGPEVPVLSRLLLRDKLSPPWPDLVLCAEASPSVIARDVKRRSAGKTRIVCLGRPAGSAANFDLVITTAQYRIPAAPNVVELSMPLAASMVADALATGKPVAVYPLPQALNAKWRLGNWLYRNAVEQPQTLMAPVRWLFDSGVVEVAPDRRKLFQRLVTEGRLGWFGEAVPVPQPGAAQRDLDRAAAALRDLVS